MKYILQYSQLPLDTLPLIGKTGNMIALLRKHDIPTPEGFVISSDSYDTFLKTNGLDTLIKQLLETIDYHNPQSVETTAACISKHLLSAKIPKDIAHEIFQAYKLHSGVLAHAPVSLLSSETYDIPFGSSSLTHRTYTSISGEAALLLKVQELWASLFSPQAILYRHQYHISYEMTRMAICMQKLIEAEKTGIILTAHPETGNGKEVIIRAVFGIEPGSHMLFSQDRQPENETASVITPDTYSITKKSLEIIEKRIGKQDTYVLQKKQKRLSIRIAEKHRHMQKITDEQITALAAIAKKIEKLYYFPHIIEWSILKEHIYITNVYPFTPTYESESQATVLATGEPITRGIASGPLRIITKDSDLLSIHFGDILAVNGKNLSLFPHVKKTAGVIIEKKSLEQHALLKLKSLGVPILIVEKLLSVEKRESIVTINSTTGTVLLGGFVNNKQKSVPQSSIHIYANIESHDDCYSAEGLQADAAYITSDFLIKDAGVHPKKIIHDKKATEYCLSIAKQLDELCRVFSPRPVFYQLSSIQTNDYRKLAFGQDFEPIEENPYLGYRGALRHRTDTASFNLELETIRILRHNMNHKNLSISIPFVRTPEELIEIRKYISAFGLYRSENFKILITGDSISTILQLDQYIQAGIDGFVINAEHMLGSFLQIDLKSSEVSKWYMSQYTILSNMFNLLIQTAKKHTLPVLFFDPIISPTTIESLIEDGITGIIIPPESVRMIKQTLPEIEDRRKNKDT